MVARVSNKTKSWLTRIGISIIASPLILFVFGIISPTPANAEEGTAQIQEPSTPPTSDTSTTTFPTDSTTVVPVDSTATPTGGETDSTQNATTTEPTTNASEEVIQLANTEVATQSTIEVSAPTVATVVPVSEEMTVATQLDAPIVAMFSSVEAPVVTETVTPGGDDNSYQIPITVPVIFNGITYTNIYATTNSVITFGNPDDTYWDYPQTPSISLESQDWWALPGHNPDMWFIIRTSEGGFQVDGSYRPYGTLTGETTQIVITAQILTGGTVSYTYAVEGPLNGNERTGARLQDGTVVSLEDAGVTQVDTPVVLAPNPISEEELAAQQAAAEAAAAAELAAQQAAAQAAADAAAAVEAARLEAIRVAAELAAQQAAAEIAAQQEATRIAAEAEAARLAVIAEAERVEAERIATEAAVAEAARIAAEVEAARVAAEQAAVAEAARIEAERLEAERIAREAAEAAARMPQIPAGASTLSESGSVEVVAPEGKRIASITAWYGDPLDGSRGIDVSSQFTQAFAGSTSATIESNNQFGDPAGGTVKVLIFLVTYEDVVQVPVAPSPSPNPTPTPEPSPESGTSTTTPEPTQPPVSPVEPLAPVQPVEPTQPSEPPTPIEPEPEAPAPIEPTPPEPPVVEPEAPVLEPEAPEVPEEPMPEPEVPAEPEPELPPAPAPTPEPTLENVINDALADGKLTEAEKEAVVDSILEDLKPGEAVNAEQLLEAGLSFEDLPPETPVDVRTDANGNPVVITAEIAAALTLLENPAELLGELFSDPGQVLLALGSIGADMSEEERETAQATVVATVIAAGAAIQAAAGAAAAAAASTGGSSGGGAPSGGGSSPRGGGDGGAPLGKEGGTRKPKTTRKAKTVTKKPTTPRKAK